MAFTTDWVKVAFFGRSVGEVEAILGVLLFIHQRGEGQQV